MDNYKPIPLKTKAASRFAVQVCDATMKPEKLLPVTKKSYSLSIEGEIKSQEIMKRDIKKNLLLPLTVLFFLFITITVPAVRNTVMLSGGLDFFRIDKLEKPFSAVAGATQKSSLKHINVTAFGTVGDGKKDDGPAIQKALNAADSTGGGVVVVPDGVYLIVNPGNGDSGKGKYGLRIGSNTTLQLSTGATLHKGGNDDVIGNKDAANGNTNIKITGGIFKTDSGTDQPWAPTRTGILLVNTSNSLVNSCTFQHIGNSAVVFTGAKSSSNKVSGCRFSDVRNAAVVFDGTANVVTGCNATDIGGDGIIINGQNCLVTGNHLLKIGYSDEPGGSGIALGVDKNPASKNRVIGNIISDTHANGIIADRGSYTLIKGNSISNTGLVGIKIGGDGNNSVIFKNTLKNTGSRSNSMGIYAHSGILIDGANVTAKYNTLSKINGSGFYINKSGSGALLLNNTINATTDADDKALKNAGIEIHAGNVSITGGSATNTFGDACYIFGNVKNVTLTGGKYGSANGASFKIDGTGDSKPSKVIISKAVATSHLGSSVVQGDDITFDEVTGDTLQVLPGATRVKKIVNKKVQVY